MEEDDHREWKGQVDSDIRGFGERIAGVESSVTNLGRSFDKFSHSFESTVERQNELQKTRWPLVFGVLSLVVVVLGAFLSGYLRDLGRVEGDVIDIRSNRVSEQDPVQNATILDNLREIQGIRLNEHKVMTENVRLQTIFDEWRPIKDMGVEHMSDGHPGRVEAMLDDYVDHMVRLEERLNTQWNKELDRLESQIHLLQRQELSEHGGP
jgi:hypothetical protein